MSNRRAPALTDKGAIASAVLDDSAGVPLPALCDRGLVALAGLRNYGSAAIRQGHRVGLGHCDCRTDQSHDENELLHEHLPKGIGGE